jgi:hypothetical protein
MARLTAFRSGSRGAQHLIARGIRPITEYQRTLYFEAPDPFKSRGWLRSASVDRRISHASPADLVPLSAVPEVVARRVAAGAASVPDFVLIRHQERRFNRLGIYALAVTLAAVAAWIPLNATWVEPQGCETDGSCSLAYLTSGPAIAALIATVTAGMTVGIFAWAMRMHHRASALEEMESMRQHHADLARTPGWSQP